MAFPTLQGFYAYWSPATTPLRGAVSVLNYNGHLYFRRIMLEDYVSHRVASELSEMSIVGITYHTRKGRLRSKKENGVTVVLLQDVAEIVTKDREKLAKVLQRSAEIMAEVNTQEPIFTPIGNAGGLYSNV